MSMSMMHIYLKPTNGANAELLKILKVLQTEKQNIAIIDSKHSVGYVVLSEFYR